MVQQGPPQVLINNVQRVPAREPSRLGKQDLQITYTINGRSTQVLTMHDEGSTAQSIEQAVKTDAARFAGIIGKTMSL